MPTQTRPPAHPKPLAAEPVALVLCVVGSHLAPNRQLRCDSCQPHQQGPTADNRRGCLHACHAGDHAGWHLQQAEVEHVDEGRPCRWLGWRWIRLAGMPAGRHHRPALRAAGALGGRQVAGCADRGRGSSCSAVGRARAASGGAGSGHAAGTHAAGCREGHCCREGAGRCVGRSGVTGGAVAGCRRPAHAAAGAQQCSSALDMPAKHLGSLAAEGSRSPWRNRVSCSTGGCAS